MRVFVVAQGWDMEGHAEPEFAGGTLRAAQRFAESKGGGTWTEATVLRGVGERGRVQWVLVPVHPAIVRQRRQINTLAHEAGR